MGLGRAGLEIGEPVANTASDRLQIHKVTITFCLKICVSANSVKNGAQLATGGGGGGCPRCPPVAPALTGRGGAQSVVFNTHLTFTRVTEAILTHCGVVVLPIHNTRSWETFTELCCLVCQQYFASKTLQRSKGVGTSPKVRGSVNLRSHLE